MHCEILTEFSQLHRLSNAWRVWVRQDAGADVFQSWEWADAYWAAYGRGLSVWSPVVYEGREPIAVLPLVRRGSGIGFLSSPWSDYNDILCAEHCSPAVLETALRVMLRDRADWTSCLLDCLPSNSKIISCLETLPQEFRSYMQLLEGSLSPTILLNEGGSEVMKELANKQKLRRLHQRLNKLGRVTFRHLETQEEARGHLDSFFHQHITRWAMAGIKSEFLSAEHRNFYRAIVEKLNPKAELRFGVLELDGRPIAYHFGFQINGKLTYYKPAFDVNYADFSPGGVLLRCLFQYAEQAGLKEFDFSRGAESYKYRYSNHVKQNRMLYIDRRPNNIVSRVRQVERRARETIRKRPSLAKAIRRIPLSLSLWYSSGRGADLKQNLLGAFGRFIWRRTDAAIFSRAGANEGEPASAKVMEESLGAQAKLLIEQPGLMDQARLHESRKRLKAGDRMLALTSRSEPFPVIVWAGKRSEVSLPVVGEEWKLSLPAEAWLIYDIWLDPGRSHQSVSCEILEVALKQSHHAEHWIVCSNLLPVPQSAVEGAGFQLRKRVSHRALFHWFRRTQVSDPEKKTERQLEPVP